MKEIILFLVLLPFLPLPSRSATNETTPTTTIFTNRFSPRYSYPEKPLDSLWVVSFPNDSSDGSLLVEFENNIELISVCQKPSEKSRTIDDGTTYIITAKRKQTGYAETFELEIPIGGFKIIWQGLDKKELETKTAVIEAEKKKRKKS